MAPNIVFAPNMTQNAERKHRTQNTNTAHFRTHKRRITPSQYVIPFRKEVILSVHNTV